MERSCLEMIITIDPKSSIIFVRQKVVLKVELHDDKIKKKAMKAVSGISGMESQHPIIFVNCHVNYIHLFLCLANYSRLKNQMVHKIECFWGDFFRGRVSLSGHEGPENDYNWGF